MAVENIIGLLLFAGVCYAIYHYKIKNKD